ncbi:hypothetical protein [Krasilnikovia sp. MM14-A1259]|uniref:hypothetical protein n=1 Tax=Krasilnikovia sp. MM14-A1259 TaxID=3373539 RepID=UPI00382BA3C5
MTDPVTEGGEIAAALRTTALAGHRTEDGLGATFELDLVAGLECERGIAPVHIAAVGGPR